MDLNQHNIISLLLPLSKDEISSAKKFISSPYFNTNKNISGIFDEIIKFHPDFENKNLNKEFIYKKIFKDKPYNDSNMRWILSEINHLLEKYFTQKHFDKDIFIKDYYLSTEYFGKMKKDSVRKVLDTAKKNLSQAEEKDYLYYLYKYIYETNELNYLGIFKRDRKSKDLDFLYSTFLKALISYVNHFIVGIINDYLSAEFMVSKYFKNGISKKINDLIKLLNFPKIVEHIEKDNEDSKELRLLTKMLYMFLYPDNDTLYSEMKKYLKDNDKSLTIGDKACYYSRLISYCRLKIANTDKEEFYRVELFEIVKLFFERKYYLQGRIAYLDPVLYKIALINSVEVANYDFADEFIEKYSSELPEAHRSNAINYGKALVSLYRKDFDNALTYSSKVGGNFFLTDQKIIRIILFIEKKYFDECEIETKAFKKFLKTNKSLSPSVKQSLDKFLFFIPHISNQPDKKKTLSKKKLNELLKDKGNIHFKDWINERIKGL